MNFQEVWRSFYGQQVPIAHLLREGKQNWLRIHSLPGSKRYVEDEMQMQEILRRASIAGTTVLGENSPCLLFFLIMRGAPSLRFSTLLVVSSFVTIEAEERELLSLSPSSNGKTEVLTRFCVALPTMKFATFRG